MESISNAILARQPILNREGEVHAYELLFRDFKELNEAHVSSDVMATSRVLINTINNLGTKNVLGDKRGFININEELVEMGLLESLEPSHFVLEILETSTISDRTLEQLKALKEAGYTLALDDFDFTEAMFTQFQDIFELVDILKVDLIECDWNVLPLMMERIRPFELLVLAEKVETQEEYRKCLELGFDLFQGYYFAKPTIIEGKKLSSSTLSVLKLVDLMQKDCETSEISEEFKRHPEITVSLLRYMNSASNSIGKQIESIHQAITLLGRRKLTRWLMLMIYAEGGQQKDTQSDPIYLLASQRAKTMENLLEVKYGVRDPKILDKAFLCGVLSLMDTLLGISLDDLLEEFNVDQDIRDALLHGKGPLGHFIEICRRQDSSQMDNIHTLLEQAEINIQEINDAYLKAYQWMGSH